MVSGTLHQENELCQQPKERSKEENTPSLADLAMASYRLSLDLLDQDLPIPEVIQRYGPEFDMAIENVLDDLGVVRTCLDDMIISTMGSDPPVSIHISRQLQQASCACNKILASVQKTLVPFIQELQAILHTENSPE